MDECCGMWAYTLWLSGQGPTIEVQPSGNPIVLRLGVDYWGPGFQRSQLEEHVCSFAGAKCSLRPRRRRRGRLRPLLASARCPHVFLKDFQPSFLDVEAQGFE